MYIEKRNLEFQNKIDTQNATIQIQNNKLGIIEKEKLEFQNKIQTQNATVENQNKELKDMMSNESSKTNRTKEILENQLKDLEKQIGSLNQFAEDMSILHLTLSEPLIRLNIPGTDQNKDDTKGKKHNWNDFTEEISKRHDVLDYVVNLKKAVALYSRTVFPKDHATRFYFAYCMIPSDFFYYGNLLKVLCPFQIPYVSLKVFKTQTEFQRELGTKRYVQNSPDVASYIDEQNGIFSVVVIHDSKNVTLYHSTDENQHFKIPCDGTLVNNIRKTGDGPDLWNEFGYFIFCFLH